MGNRTYLAFGERCEFEANNCLPVAWLALFDTGEFLVETRRFEYEKPRQEETTAAPGKGILAALRSLLNRAAKQPAADSTTSLPTVEVCWEDCEVAVFKTSPAKARRRAERAIDRLRGRTPIWTYLRPLEILAKELQACSPDDSIELNVTELWAMGSGFTDLATRGPESFAGLLDGLTGELEQDLALLDKIVNDFNLAQEVSVRDLDSEMRMFVLIGTYWGQDPGGQPYPLEHFSDAYWAGSA